MAATVAARQRLGERNVEGEGVNANDVLGGASGDLARLEHMVLGLAAAVDLDQSRHRIAVAALIVSTRASARERQQGKRKPPKKDPARAGHGPPAADE